MVEQESLISSALENAVWAFTLVRRRYPLLMDTAAELGRVREHVNVYGHNDGLMQIMRDSFDMLVIDLFSIRESLVERGGLLDLVRQSPQILRRRSPEEFHPNETGAGLSDEERTRMLPDLIRLTQERYARGINTAINRLVGSSDPVTAESVDQLIADFRRATEALDRDRNRVRAHRYQRGSHDTTHLFIPLPDLVSQIGVVERLLADFYLIVHNGSFAMEMTFACDPTGTAESLADLLVHGTINRATLAYGAVPTEPSGADDRPWYWAKREAVIQGRVEPRNIPSKRQGAA
ncbi:MAG TPA: hypothetical protein VH374_03935 [Polyangia bacterium]|jgi:hypothetical protein|nr:hypothetical protein [Polyangia bacterium]